MDLQERVTDLESRLAFQDDTIETSMTSWLPSSEPSNACNCR